MQSLFNKRNGNNSSINEIFSLPPTNIIQTEPEPMPVFKTPEPIQEEENNPRETEEQRAEKLTRTIFIGNVKINTNKKDLKTLLLPFGKVEKIWYRLVPVEQSKMGPKASYILKKFQQNAESMNAYARFQDVEQAEAALELNGRTFNELTLRVASAGNKDEDFERTVFIGNLPFDVKQEEMRKHFHKVGTIENVRVIRDKFTHQGIGIGYIMFAKPDEMKRAISELNGSELRGRNLRIKKAVEKKRLEKKKRKFIDPKQVNRTAAMKRIQQKTKDYEPYPQQQEKQQPVQNKPQKKFESAPKSVQKPVQKSVQKPVQQKPVQQKHVQQKTVQKPAKQKPKKTQKPKRTPISEKKKPHVTKQDTQQDKQLRNEVSEQLKLLKRKMITKPK